MIGFTGTPILLKNSSSNDLTTESIFGKMIHSYTIKTFNENIQRSIYPQKLIDLILDFVNEQLKGLEIKNNLIQNVIKEDKLHEYIDNFKKLELEKILDQFKLPEDDFYEIIKQYEETDDISYKSIKDMLKINKDERLNSLMNKEELKWWEFAKNTSKKIIYLIKNLYDSIRI